MILQLTRHRVELGLRGDVAASPEICSPGVRHALHISPADIVEVALDQARHPTAHRQHLVAEVDAGTHRDPRQLVHARGQRPGVHDRDPFARGIRHRRPRLGDGPVDVDHHLEPGATRRDGGLVVTLCYVIGDPAGRHHGGQQRSCPDPVAVHADENRFGLGTGFEHLGNRLDAAGGRHPTVVGRGFPAALDVPQDRDPGVLPTLLLQDVADAVRRDRLALPVRGALGNHQDRVASPGPPAPAEDIHHAVLPTVPGRGFRQEGVVRSTCYGAHQRQVTAVASHHLDDEGSLV